MGYGTCERIPTAKFVPCILTVDQKQLCVCEELCQIACYDATLLSRVITGDESWIYSYGPETAKVLPMEKSILTETENDETGEEENQENAHHFL
jgi:hypothetical protein